MRWAGWLGLLAVLALISLVAPAKGEPEVSALPTIACGSPAGGLPDLWCGRWQTNAPVPSGGAAPLDPLGGVVLDRLDEATGRPLIGQSFGNMSFPAGGVPCGASGQALFYAGRYDGAGGGGGAGTILACTTALPGASELTGNYKTAGGRQGEFVVRYVAGAAGGGPPTFLGHLGDFNLGVADQGWSGTCLLAPCRPGQPDPSGTRPAPAVPGAATSPDQPPLSGPPLFRILAVNGDKTFLFSAADRHQRSPKAGWLLGAGDALKIKSSAGGLAAPGGGRAPCSRSTRVERPLRSTRVS